MTTTEEKQLKINKGQKKTIPESPKVVKDQMGSNAFRTSGDPSGNVASNVPETHHCILIIAIYFRAVNITAVLSDVT